MSSFTGKLASSGHPSKAVLPAEIISTILDHLDIPDLMTFARTSKRILEMVYEDSRWVVRLKAMEVWDDNEARRGWNDAVRAQKAGVRERGRRRPEKQCIGTGVGQGEQLRKRRSMLFDAELEEHRQERLGFGYPETSEGFKTLESSASSRMHSTSSRPPTQHDEAVLNIFSTVRSIRGSAKQEYSKVYVALRPFYQDLATSRSHKDLVIFRVYRTPEQQAKMLAQLQIFARSDWAQGWRQKDERLATIVGIFENAVLREFEQGYESLDIEGRMHRYAYVLGILNGGHACIELYVQKLPIFLDQQTLGHPKGCINHDSSEVIALEPSQRFLERLSIKINEQVDLVDRVFPPTEDVLQILLDKVCEDILIEYVTPLFDEAHGRSIPSYLKAVSGIFEQTWQFAMNLRPTKAFKADFEHAVKAMVARVFEPHIDLYLQDELDYFKQEAERQVGEWESRLSEQEASTEYLYMAKFDRRADKSDFLSSFKKVVMMPVNVLPIGTAKPTTTFQVGGGSRFRTPSTQTLVTRPWSSSRPHSLGLKSPAVSTKIPNTELTAKAALMASKLEGIRSLFSIEIALELTHAAQASIERASRFVRLEGQTGGEAREQCQSVFVILLQVLGTRHIKVGFDKAVDHLSKYNPREISEHHQQVAPLTTFLELVNVGDLISQMIDVFYEQQLASAKLTDRNDFLDPAVKAKKKFEQMLDERVAAGLSKGIDVLIDEVEFVYAATQQPTDFNPPPSCAPAKSPIAHHFEVRVGLRLFTALCKHLKRQRISMNGAMRLISDMNVYWEFIKTLRNSEMETYFKALRELSQIYLVDAKKHAKELAVIIADGNRWSGVFRAEEVLEFAERRADWYVVKRDVERAMYGLECVVC